VSRFHEEGQAIILHVVGARPQIIKLAPVVKAFRDAGLDYRILHTGQHYDPAMSDVHFRSLRIEEPHYSLGVGSDTHARQTGLMMEGIEGVLEDLRPACVLVYGDTNSTLAGALSASKLKIPVGHVESGVRSFDRTMPEEINRIVADHVSTHHFCPTRNAMSLLRREGIEGVLTGDVMYDAILHVDLDRVPHPFTPPYALVTIHRAENTDDESRFLGIWGGLGLVSQEIPVVFPVHPRTQKAYRDLLSRGHEGITLVDPLDYPTMLAAVRDASLVITDSGGVQKEAFLLKTPCVTVRDTTEWPETVDAGANILAEARATAVRDAAHAMLGIVVNTTGNPFGNGLASRAIAGYLRERYA